MSEIKQTPPSVVLQRAQAAEHAKSIGALDVAGFEKLFYSPQLTKDQVYEA